MLCLVVAHRLDDRTRALIRGREPGEVPVEMLLDLPLGFREKRQVPAIAERTGKRADGERARIPERIKQARPPAELTNALGAPGEVVFLLARRMLERASRARNRAR